MRKASALVNTGANIAQGEPYCTRFGRHCPQADGSCKYPAKCLCLTYSEQTGKCPLNRNHRRPQWRPPHGSRPKVPPPRR
jgi:hypothetical protein